MLVNNKSRRNQNASSRNSTRYYQSSPGGKYDGLKPGVLDAETRQLLGLGNQKRRTSLPGSQYLPRRKIRNKRRMETDYPELPKKTSVEFPGINAPIPENADERRWTVGHSSLDLSRNQSNRRFNRSLEPSSRYYQEQRFPRDFGDDGPPGVDPVTNPSLSSYPPRYGGYDSSYPSYSQRENNSIP